MDAIDGRLKNTSNLISQIRLMKLSALEDKFSDDIKGIREKEIHHRKIKAIFDISSSVLFLSMNLAMLIAAFALYYIYGLTLSPSTAFTLISIAGILRHPLTWFAQTLKGLIKGYVSLERLQGYFDCEEIDNKSFINAKNADCKIGDDLALLFKESSFTWGDSFKLSKINLSVQKGDFVAVIGKYHCYIESHQAKHRCSVQSPEKCIISEKRARFRRILDR